MTQQTSKNPTTLSSSSVYSAYDKYNGLIKQSVVKVMKKYFINFFSYIYSIVPYFIPMHNVVSFFRLLQLAMPALFITNMRLWPDGKLDSNTMRILEVLYHLVPSQYQDSAFIPLIIITLVINLLILVIVVFFTLQLKSKGKLPLFVMYLVAIYYSTAGMLLPPIAFNLIFREISRLIFTNSNLSSNSLAGEIILIIVSIALIFINFHIYVIICSETIEFRQLSLMTVLNKFQIFIRLGTIAVTSLSALSTYATKIPNIVICVLTLLSYSALMYAPYIGGGVIKNRERIMVSSTIMSCMAFSLIGFVFVAVERESNLIIFSVFIIAFIIICITLHLFSKKYEARNLVKLDMISDDPETFSKFFSKNPDPFFSAAVVGFKNCHPVCLSYAIFNIAARYWPKNGYVWLIYAKFLAIYPDEDQALAWVYRSVLQNDIHGNAARCIKYQMSILFKTREENLNLELKRAIASILKQVTSAKHKMRHIWDLIIQGNYREIEESANRTWDVIEKTYSEFQDLFRQYPNNRFVLRPYVRFVSDIIGDNEETVNLSNKLRMVQRGMLINADKFKELGIITFPNLPFIKRAKRNNILSEQSMNDANDIEAEGGVNGIGENDNRFLKKKINDLSVPSIKYSIILRLVFIICLFIVPAIVLIVYTNKYVNDSTKIIEHMYNLALVRTMTYQIAASSSRSIFEKLGQMYPVSQDGVPPKSLGSSWNTMDQVVFLLKEISSKLQLLTTFKSFQSQSKHIQNAKEYIFERKTPYLYYTTPWNYTEEYLDVLTGIIDFAIQLENIKKMELRPSVVNTSVILNPCYNADYITISINTALESMSSSLDENYKNMSKIAQYVFIIVICFMVLVYLIFTIVQIFWISRTKEETYKCLTTLPKNIVSNLVENLRVLKKDTDTENFSSSYKEDSDINKQEENVLKVLNTGSSRYSSSKLDAMTLVITEIIVLVFHILTTVFLTQLITSCPKNILDFAPHLDYLMGAYSYTITMIFSINNAVQAYFNGGIQLWQPSGNIAFFYQRIGESKDYYYKARFGGRSKDAAPFQGFMKVLQESQEKIDCTNPTLRPSTFKEAVKCYDANVVFSLISTYMDAVVHPAQVRGEKLDNMDPAWANVWDIMIYPIYETFFNPMFESIVPTITEQLTKLKSDSYMACYIFIVLAALMEMVGIAKLISIKRHIKLVLNFLLHCPSEVILQSTRIMKVLGGNFTRPLSDFSARDDDFYNDVLMELPDAVFVADQTTYEIQSFNEACARIYGQRDFIGLNLKEFFARYSDAHSAMSTTENHIITLKQSDGTDMYVNYNVNNINNKITIVSRDITSVVKYNNLIEAEKNRSDDLLNSILPPTLVKRVQAGEETISFEVQSAAIVFMDIVSFTPWCGSVPATTVMSTLNLMFKKYDAKLATYETLTKMKCIGDCYMAAGGLFTTVSQPNVHTKEAVNFGLDSISELEEMNKEIGESLQIRVGVNTGGPIVAGVLGVGKPTFEIFGPAINMAQQMEHNGVAMKVHISRSVYELIYGDAFVIKERGSIEVKGKPVLTYLVTSHT